MNESLLLTSTVQEDEITNEVSKMFDYAFSGSVTEEIAMPNFPTDFQIGLIVGSSGSGKSTILKEKFGEPTSVEWDNSKAIVSNFNSFEEASNLFGAVGLNSIPTWCKPYNVLSTGEKFRADMARLLKDGAVIDEFTSVVNREVAISCSCSISKYIKKTGLKNIVFASCHDDIIPYLDPDWVYNTDEQQFYTGRYLRQPIVLETHSCDSVLWTMFKKYHYLSGDLNSAARCFVGLLGKRPVAFAAIITMPVGGIKHGYREHRLVVHPDYQGMGIGNKFSEMIGQAFIEKGCRYFCKTSNPRIGIHRDNSPLWRGTLYNHKARADYLTKDGVVYPLINKKYTMSDEKVIVHSQRVCYAHEYIGDGTIYPYTLDHSIGSRKDVDGQISLFDFGIKKE